MDLLQRIRNELETPAVSEIRKDYTPYDKLSRPKDITKRLGETEQTLAAVARVAAQLAKLIAETPGTEPACLYP